MKLGLWEDAIAHNTLINTELRIIVQERRNETSKASILAPSITQNSVHLKNQEKPQTHNTLHLHNALFRAIHKPKDFYTWKSHGAIESTT